MVVVLFANSLTVSLKGTYSVPISYMFYRILTLYMLTRLILALPFFLNRRNE